MHCAGAATATFQAGHASSILVTRSAAKALGNGVILPIWPRADFSAIGLVALPVLVGACRLLPGVVLSWVSGTPAHYAAVPDPPHTEADMASIKTVQSAAS
jgi:hypothetical protein